MRGKAEDLMLFDLQVRGRIGVWDLRSLRAHRVSGDVCNRQRAGAGMRGRGTYESHRRRCSPLKQMWQDSLLLDLLQACPDQAHSS